MEYEKIIKKINKPKRSHQKSSVAESRFERFSILKSDKVETLVDHDIADDVKNRKWCIDSGGYATSNVDGDLIRLHEYVMAKTYGHKPDDCYVDHINQDKLDNRRINLRFVNPTESGMVGWTCPVCGRGLSPFTTVCSCKDKWEVTC